MSLFARKPETIRDVIRRVKNGERKFDQAILEFLDVFYAHPALRQAAINDEPEKIDALRDAYVAAVAEHLARLHALQVPGWTEMHGNGLHEPFFAGGLHSLRGILFAESPAAFRRRLLFVSENALSRPRQAQSPVGEVAHSSGR
jgi:hypothetical protein